MSRNAPLPPKSAVITIIGAGFTGGTVAIQQLRHYVSLRKGNKNLPPLTIRLIDRAGDFGPGFPLSVQNDVRQKDDDALAEILAEEFGEAIAAGIPVTLDKRTDEIFDVAPHPDGITLAAKRSSTLETQALVLAMDNQHEGDSIALVGAGYSLPEALDVLGYVGFKGDIYALSHSLVLPWSFDPAFYRQPLPPFRPLYLDAERVKKAQDQSTQGLERRFKLEVRRAHELGYGVAHVLKALDFEALAQAGPEGASPAGWQSLHDIREAFYANPVSPQGSLLLQRYINSGRLKLLKTAVRKENLFPEPGGFLTKNILFGKKPEPGKTVPLAIIFNAAALKRRPPAKKRGRSSRQPCERIRASQRAAHQRYGSLRESFDALQSPVYAECVNKRISASMFMMPTGRN